MSENKKYKKRIVAFLIIPILITALILSNDLIIQVVVGFLLALYAGFIIFLRDSIRDKGFDKIEEQLKKNENIPKETENNPNKLDFGDEGFEVVARGKTVISDDESFAFPQEITREAIEEYNKIIGGKLTESDSNEFIGLLKHFLIAVRESLSANSALFFIYNPLTEKISLRAYDTAIPNGQIFERKFDLEQDVLSRIATKNEPEILNNITPNIEIENIRYYSTRQNIRSFCGVPFNYNNQLVLILAVDSKSGEAFGVETIYFLGRYIRIISTLLSLFEENFNKKTDEKRLSALLGLISVEKSFEKFDEMISFLMRTAEELFAWDFMTFVSIKAGDAKFKVQKIKSKSYSTKYIGEGFEIDLAKSAVGEAIKKGIPVYKRDISEKNAHRFSPEEKIFTEGSFLAIPLIFDGQNYGAVTFESLKKSNYSKNDIAFIKKAVKLFAYYVHNYVNTAYLKNLISLDPATLVLTRKEFFERTKSYLSLEKLCDKEGVIALISVDLSEEEASLFDNKILPKAMKSIASLIKEELRENSFIGKLSGKIFGVYFFDFDSNDVKIWAEKTRKKIAQSTFTGLSNQARYTVSIGTASTKGKERLEKIIGDAEMALQKSIDMGGNKVTVGS